MKVVIAAVVPVCCFELLLTLEEGGGNLHLLPSAPPQLCLIIATDTLTSGPSSCLHEMMTDDCQSRRVVRSGAALGSLQMSPCLIKPDK